MGKTPELCHKVGQQPAELHIKVGVVVGGKRDVDVTEEDWEEITKGRYRSRTLLTRCEMGEVEMLTVGLGYTTSTIEARVTQRCSA